MERRINLLIKLLQDTIDRVPRGQKRKLGFCLKRLIIHAKLLKNEPMLTKELYLWVLTHLLFNRSIDKGYYTMLNGGLQDGLGLLISEHNRQVKEAFQRSKINWAIWHAFPEVERRDVDYHEAVPDKNGKWLEIMRDCQWFAAEFLNTPLIGAIRKDIAEIQKRKKEIISGSISDTKENCYVLFKRFYESRKHYVKKGIEIKPSPNFSVRLESVYHKIFSLSSKPKLLRLSVRLWDRSFRDIFQGNFSDCCVAIGIRGRYPGIKLPGVTCHKYPAGILNYLTDLGVQVAEIRDEDLDITIGQCWLFVSPDKDGPVLVVDSTDVIPDYSEHEVLNAAMRDCMFSFLKKYAEAIRVNRIVIGEFGPYLGNAKFHGIKHDLSWSPIREYEFSGPITKLGGYLLNQPYFLETCGATLADLIYDNGRVGVARTKKDEFVPIKSIDEYVKKYGGDEF